MTYLFLAGIVGLVIWRTMPARGVQTITADDLVPYLQDKDKQFIDVRTNREFAVQQMDSFINIPLPQLKTELEKLDKTKETFIICQTGMRSSQAATQLKRAGFQTVINVKGGICQWTGCQLR